MLEGQQTTTEVLAHSLTGLPLPLGMATGHDCGIGWLAVPPLGSVRSAGQATMGLLLCRTGVLAAVAAAADRAVTVAEHFLLGPGNESR